ncbi:hypothetical protein DL93DRAFT_2073122 [Clavulina sp. PMI_390]|nr:hypothetical protein DL93DRAFT_2073122 [Clavulina sp. PMI_390]
MSDPESNPQMLQTPMKRRADEMGSPADEIRKAKARERQRRKRAKDRENAGLPAVQPRDQRPPAAPPLVGRLRDGETEEEKKARVREAARLRQQKHRMAVRLRRQHELDNPTGLGHDAYYGKDLVQMYDGPEGAAGGYNPPPGNVFANSVLLALAADPNLKFHLMRIYSITEEEFPSLEQGFAMAFDHWNHARYAASHAAHYGQMPHGPPPAPHPHAPEAGPSEENPNIDGRLSRVPQPAHPEDPNAIRTANGAMPPPWAVAPGAQAMQTIYSAQGQQAGPPVVDAHGHPIQGAGQPGQGYFLSQNQEPPHFRRHRGAGGSGAPNGEDGAEDGAGGSAQGSARAQSPNHPGAGQDGEEREHEDDNEDADEEAAARAEQEGEVVPGAIAVDPQEEQHRWWNGLMQARLETEQIARAKTATFVAMQTQT